MHRDASPIAMRTPLYDRHVALNAKIVDFHGWDMPLYYSGIINEHMAVRENFGYFDVSHMGDVIVEGKDSGRFLDHLLPTQVSRLEAGKAAYTAFLDESGNIIDDTIVYRLSADKFFFVPNASTTGEIVKWASSHSDGLDVTLRNVSSEIACIALQGPRATIAAQKIGIREPEPFTFYSQESGDRNSITGNREIIVSGTGYTGEKGMELIVPASEAEKYWIKLEGLTRELGGQPCGLGSRDTLRMEKGMLLSGTDFDHNRTPFEASVGFIVNEEHEFIGKESLLKSKSSRNEIFRGFKVDGKAIPRSGFPLMAGGKRIGTVTSGSISPVLKIPIALGFLDKSYSKEGTAVKVRIRSEEYPATVSKPRIIR